MGTKLRFFHSYHPETWQAQIDCGLVREGDGVRFPQSLLVKKEFAFNAQTKGSELYEYMKKTRAPFYIDRLQGGAYIEEYPYDMALVDEYREMLGENFYGWQMHEWLSNYVNDLKRVKDVPDAEWSVEAIKRAVFEKYPGKYLFLESMSAEEMYEHGKPKNADEHIANMTDIYKKRLRTHGELVPCDSFFIAYDLEFQNGARVVMPEVGAQTPDMRLQIGYARGEAKAYGKEFGAYYEPWGGSPFSACCYQKDERNEWGIGEAADFPFVTAGPNGGSSRSLQWRVMLYAYLSGATMISEEWGLCNTFIDWENFELSPYGKVKKEFLDFVRKYDDIGEKLAPAAVILPSEMTVLDNIREPYLYCGYKIDAKYRCKLEYIKDSVKRVFSVPTEFLGTEYKTLINSHMPDAVDMLNAGEGKEDVINSYRYLVDLTCDKDFAKTHKNCVRIDDLADLLRDALPCTVEGMHWFVNEREGGGYYLTVFNNVGIERSVAKGEISLDAGRRSAKVTFKNGAEPTMLEGNGELTPHGDAYTLTLPAGGFAFIRF